MFDRVLNTFLDLPKWDHVKIQEWQFGKIISMDWFLYDNGLRHERVN